MLPTLETFRKTLDSVDSNIEEVNSLYHYLQNIREANQTPPFILAQMPEATRLFHLLNPSFSFEPQDKNTLDIYPFRLLRDGLIPLVNFFSSPSTYQSIILIHQDFAFLIPPKNKNKVYLYNLRPRRSSILNRNKVFITGILNGANFSLEYLKKQMKRISQSLKKKGIPWNHVYFNFYIRENIFFSVDEKKVNPLVYYLKEVSRFTDGKTNFLEENALYSIDDFSDWFYVCLHENAILVADNFLEHTLLGRGGLPLFKKKELQNELFLEISVSPYHSYVIKEFKYSKESCRFKEIDNMLKFFSKESSKIYGPFFFYIRKILEEMQ